ncbi:iron ABC transporter permease [Petroclostridium sp. X23]|uniref:FecCD family ABC transporter permease n=1 Tax=Petroclostridium sp. X23 TaxID=3045146 RepID=UPI0024AE5393|nr:iron ABC transporter permease [Petroclostridium sp. X23]WHH58728.1 iron ABC transporter permease [Petroclostridium sp. X23]
MAILKKNRMLFIVVLVAIPLLTALTCIGIGRYSLTIGESFQVLLHALLFGKESVDAQSYSVIIGIRLPRIILALLCGAGLAVSGASFQALFTNPLATPDTLGVAAGASFGAVVALLAADHLIWVQAVALLMGLAAVFLTYSISKIRGKSTIIMMVLSGMVISSMFQAFVSLIKYMADPEDKLPAITYWLMGSLSSVTYKSLLIGTPFILIGIILVSALRWKLNVLSLSEDEAHSMGVNVKHLRLLIIVAATMITASAISMCGQVGWIGLLIPHIARMLFGSNNRFVIPASISFGAVFMLVIDTVARSATAAEIPVSILTATVGAPFFIFLLKRTGGAWT